MNKILILSFLLSFLLSCHNNSTNNLPDFNQIDRMTVKDISQHTTYNVDPFSKGTSYSLPLFSETGIENKYATCLIDSSSAVLIIKPDTYLSDYPDVKIVSQHNPVREFGTIAVENTVMLSITNYLKYFRDENFHIRLIHDYHIFDLALDKNELRGVYMAYILHKKLFTR